MKTMAITCMLTAVLACQSRAAMLDEGTREISVSGSLEQDDSTVLLLAFTGGYFVRRATEVGGKLTLETAGRAYTQTHAGAFLEWNWDTKLPVVPYLGTYIGLAHATETDEGSDVGIEWSGWGGAKCYLLENLAFGAQLQIWLATDDMYLSGTDASGRAEYSASEWGFVLRTCFYF